MKHSLTIRLGATGRTISGVPGYPSLDLDSPTGKLALRYIRAGIEARQSAVTPK